MFVPRSYQEAALGEAERLVRSGVKRFIFQGATGCGKTGLATETILRGLRKGSRFLFIAHRHELLKQPYEKLLEMDVPIEELSVIKSGERALYRPNASVQIASTLSLQNRALPPADVVFVDEGHRSASPTVVKILSQYPHAVVIALTATPERLDGRSLGDIYEEIIIVAQPSELIRGGWIVKPDVYTVPPDFLPDLSAVRHSGKEYNQRDLGVAVNTRKLLGSIVDHWLTHACGIRTICFATTIEHSKRIVEEFNARDMNDNGVIRKIRAVHIDGDTPMEEREQARLDLKSHKVDIVSQVDIWIEGIDIPEAKCAILARPTESLTVYLQSVGRIVRPWNGEIAIVLDHSGNAMKHGAPHLDREFSLDPKPKGRRASQESPDNFRTKTCQQCYAVVDVTEIVDNMCPRCSASFPIVNRTVETVDGTLVRLGEENPLHTQIRFFNHTWMKAYVDGHDGSWVNGKFRDRFGELPQASWQPPVRPVVEYTDEEKWKDRRDWAGIAHRNGFPSGWAERRYFAKFGEVMPSGTLSEASKAKAHAKIVAIETAKEPASAVPMTEALEFLL